MSGWDAYVTNLTAGKALEYAAILGKDGNIWASNFGKLMFELLLSPPIKLTFQIKMTPRKSHKKTITNKLNCLLVRMISLANNGVAKHKAGIRLNNQKYYPVQFDAEVGSMFLKKEKGGACLAQTNTGIVFASWSSTINMENGQPQNAAECNKRVLDMQKYLKDQNI